MEGTYFAELGCTGSGNFETVFFFRCMAWMLSIAEWSTWSLSILTRAEFALPSLVSFSNPIKLRIADSSDLSCLPMKEERVLKLSVLEGSNSVDKVSGVCRWWGSVCVESVLGGTNAPPPSWEWEPVLDSLEWKLVLGKVEWESVLDSWEWEPVLGKVEWESVLDKEPLLQGGPCWNRSVSSPAGMVEGWSAFFGFLPTLSLLWETIETANYPLLHSHNIEMHMYATHVHAYHISWVF